MTCDAGSSIETGYRFKVWQRSGVTEEIEVRLECTSNPEAYVLAMKFLALVGYAIFRAQLIDWRGGHLMYYTPKAGWSFGDGRDQKYP